MHLLLLCLAVFLGLSVSLEVGGGSCETSLDCWLNGDCVGGSCACDSVWLGSQCNVLAQLPSTQLWPTPVVPSNLTALGSGWSATIVQDDDGLWHGFFETVCAQFTWMHIAGAQVIHATATSVEGPYTFSDIALPAQSMTPHIVRDTDGSWLLLHERQPNGTWATCTGAYNATTGPAVCNASCAATAAVPADDARGRGSPVGPPYANGPPSAARSTSLYGPWTPHDFSISLLGEGMVLPNPNPSLLPPTAPGGAYLLAFTSMPANFTTWGDERVQVATAAAWNSSTFTQVNLPDPNSHGEDPFLWRSARGYHIVYHRMAPNGSFFAETGGYAVSLDGSHWVYSPTPIYNTSVPWAASGGAPIEFLRRERPQFLRDATTGALTHLLTGCELVVNAAGHSSLSVITPLGLPPPRRVYTVSFSEKGLTPALSSANPVGGGFSPCNFTYNPAWLEPHPPALNKSAALIRVSGCTEAAGGALEHMMFAYCSVDGTCEDIEDSAVMPFETEANDPRAFYNPADSNWYVYYWHNNTGIATINLRRSPTPTILTSWALIAEHLPWRRNGCPILNYTGDGTHLVIYGETYGTLYPGNFPVGVGIASTTDFLEYEVLNATWSEPCAIGPEPEVGIEASTVPARLSTGDYVHLYAVGTPGWSPNYGPGLCGSYTAGFLILNGTDPTQILQRSASKPLKPSMDYEIGNGIYPVNRNNTLFVTSVVPIGVDTFRIFYGAADANVATAIMTVTYEDTY